MTCHNCQHYAEIERIRQACMNCKLGNAAVHETVSLDALADRSVASPRLKARPAAGVRTVATYNPDGMDEPPAAPSPESIIRDSLVFVLSSIATMPYHALPALRRVIDAFDGLTDTEFALVQHFLNGGTMAEYARSVNISRQTAFARCKSLFRKKPFFASIANGLLGKLKGGRRAAPRRITQPSLFDFDGFGESA